MLFNSPEFALFFPTVFGLYWLLSPDRVRYQNLLIILASYVFYGWWDLRFLGLIAFSTLLDFFVGIGLSKTDNQGQRKSLLYLSILTNIGLLGVFKYYNFFADNLVAVLSSIGLKPNIRSLNIILPVGISFYTFQTLSYTIDVYRNKLVPTRDITAFAAFVSFFPQLVAGPIERATSLLPQFYKKRNFSYLRSKDALFQILWGFFKKLVIADNCAIYVNHIFDHSNELSGTSLFVGAVLFAFQIYGDFSGYSDMAIGFSRWLGFDLTRNFAFPYFSRDVAEFWRRWHISLSTWFRDYVYIPLGGSHGGRGAKIRNTFVIFITSGFWHGASWTFIVWGLLNALYFLPLQLTNSNRRHLGELGVGSVMNTVKEIGQMILTFLLITLAWIFFRANSLTHAFAYVREIFSNPFSGLPEFMMSRHSNMLYLLLAFFLIIEWTGRNREYGLEYLVSKSKFSSYLVPYLVIMISVLFMSLDIQEFIYFQF